MNVGLGVELLDGVRVLVGIAVGLVLFVGSGVALRAAATDVGEAVIARVAIAVGDGRRVAVGAGVAVGLAAGVGVRAASGTATGVGVGLVAEVVGFAAAMMGLVGLATRSDSALVHATAAMAAAPRAAVIAAAVRR